MLGQDFFQAAGDAHQLLLVDLQVDGHHQLVPQLFIELVKQLATHVDHFQQRGVHFIGYFSAVPLFQLSDIGIALEQGVALLVNFKLFKPQVGNAISHILQLIRRRQRLLLLIKNARQQQAALEHGNLLFNIPLRLQSAVEPVLYLDIALHQLVAILRRLDQLLAQLVVNIQLLLDQRVGLNTRGFIRRDRLLGGFLSQRQPLAVHRLLQQLQLMLQPVAPGGYIVTLLLQGILQDSVAFEALTLLLDLRVEQRLLGLQQHLLGRTQSLIAHRGAIQTITDLLQLLGGVVHRILHPFRLRLQGNQLAVVGCQIVLRILQIVQRLGDA